jgi:two-component system, OmpR family, sensor histidine kinase ChvG
LSEAARLEQSVASAEVARIGLRDLVTGCVDGYRVAYGDRRFELRAGQGEFLIRGSDDLLAQLLDKLISNAVSFGAPDEPIVVELAESRDQIALTVVNYGSMLPGAMQKQIFNSMVSLREARTDNEPHLGLGLFIARLIAEFHGGRIRAYNLDAANGVAFEVTLPRSN